MQLKFENGVPFATQIAEKLKRDIISGVYAPGEAFPTVRELAFTFAVNPTTMQKALSIIEAEGLIITHSTTGRSVTTSRETIDAAKESAAKRDVSKLVKNAKDLGLQMNELIEAIKKGWEENE